MRYEEYVSMEFRRLEAKFRGATLDRHERRILKALHVVLRLRRSSRVTTQEVPHGM